MKQNILSFLLVAAACTGGFAFATETENLGMQVLPAPGKVVVDGKFDDWDLSGGVLVCGDVENLREKLGVWCHAMYDDKNVYILARWLDETPLNNPGSSRGDYGFAGDCLQFRTITAAGTPNERGQHFTAWRDRDGISVVKIEQGTQFKEGVVENAIKEGAQQGFGINADKKGYSQEIAIPWKLLVRDGVVLKAGDKFTLTVEPNFTIGIAGRLSLKDLFKPGITPDRVFTFMASQHWGPAYLEPKGNLTPKPIRLADGREFPMKIEAGLPVIDWTGLIKTKTRQGFRTIAFNMPEDGYVSLNIFGADGTVARQLLSCEFLTKGQHEIPWDGLGTLNWRTPGQPVAPGEYTWEAIWHKGIGLRLVGWAANSGASPWDGRTLQDNWGGDHGIPASIAADSKKVYLGWSGAEAGKALLACDLNGAIQWKNSRAGMAGAELIAIDGDTLYAQHWGGDLYRLETAKGGYTNWKGTESTDVFIKSLWGDEQGMPEKADAIDARDGKVYLAFTKANLVVVLDGQSGNLLKRHTIPSPGDVKAVSPSRVLVSSEGHSVLALDPESGKTTPFLTGLKNARALTTDAAGRIYVGLGDPDNQVHVFDAEGKLVQKIGRAGGRPLLGKWASDGLRFVADMAVDAEGKLWVAEADISPKRFSVWDTRTGAFVKELFGPTTYGALGGAINPLDPSLMVGQGCEWKIDSKSGRDTCLGVIHRDGMENARFGVGKNGKLYLAVATRWTFDLGPLHIYERLGDADYKLRATVFYTDADGKEVPPPAHGQTGSAKKTAYWCDENGDSQRQPNEITLTDGLVRLSGWYMPMNPDLAFYTANGKFAVTGYSACGAPKYDLANPARLPQPNFDPVGRLGSIDGKYLLSDGPYGVDNGQFVCHDIASGKVKWTYPDNFIGVHGSHKAVPPETGMVRGSFGPCGAARFPEPLGNVWIVPTNCGEWHVLTEKGYYLTRLFQGDPLKVNWPEVASPGAILDNIPPGLGGEDFGGSVAQAKDGKLFLQAGKTGFWNVEVVGLEDVQALPGGKLSIGEADVRTAGKFREAYLQEQAANRKAIFRKGSPTFTGDLKKDFARSDEIKFQKADEAAVIVRAAWDDEKLYLGWEVRDATPWKNAASDPIQMYIGGDTVDFQLAADPAAPKDRKEDAAGDLRLSIGNFAGKPTAVLYRKVSAVKKPRVFSSGVVKAYAVDYVEVLTNVEIKVTLRDNSYVVEAAVPLAQLGLKPAANVPLRGDFGVTHGDAAGQRTRLRSYWSNQHTGIVDDAVFELKLEPANWGEISFQP